MVQCHGTPLAAGERGTSEFRLPTQTQNGDKNFRDGKSAGSCGDKKNVIAMSAGLEEDLDSLAGVEECLTSAEPFGAVDDFRVVRLAPAMEVDKGFFGEGELRFRFKLDLKLRTARADDPGSTGFTSRQGSQ